MSVHLPESDRSRSWARSKVHARCSASLIKLNFLSSSPNGNAVRNSWLVAVPDGEILPPVAVLVCPVCGYGLKILRVFRNIIILPCGRLYYSMVAVQCMSPISVQGHVVLNVSTIHLALSVETIEGIEAPSL